MRNKVSSQQLCPHTRKLQESHTVGEEQHMQKRVAQMMSQREEKVLGTGWKTERRTWGDQEATAQRSQSKESPN